MPKKLTIAYRILKILNANQGRYLSAKEIWRNMNIPLQHVRCALTWLIYRKLVCRTKVEPGRVKYKISNHAKAYLLRIAERERLEKLYPPVQEETEDADETY